MGFVDWIKDWVQNSKNKGQGVQQPNIVSNNQDENAAPNNKAHDDVLTCPAYNIQSSPFANLHLIILAWEAQFSLELIFVQVVYL